VKSSDRYCHFGVASSKLAIADAQLDLEKINKERFGVILGSAFGGADTFEKQAANVASGKNVSPFAIPMLLGNTAAGIIGIELDAQGPNFAVNSACAAGSHAIGEAMRSIQNGKSDIMLAGGAEASMTPLMFGGFCAMKAMCSTFNDHPSKASRPFDANRAGFIMGEGAGMLLLESEEHAIARGANIYCELSGYGATCDAHHITTPHPEGRGLSKCFSLALEDAGVQPIEIDYINAHGTSTAYNDKFESLAIKEVFGEHAYNLKVSSTKCMTGHTLGAAGGIEAAIVAKVLQTGDIPPTMNYENPDPDCDLDYVPNKAQHIDSPRAAISDNLGFGGHNAALVFKAYN